MNREQRLLEIRKQYYQANEEYSKAMGDSNNRGLVFPEFYFLIDFRRTYERLQALRWDGADHPGWGYILGSEGNPRSLQEYEEVLDFFLAYIHNPMFPIENYTLKYESPDSGFLRRLATETPIFDDGDIFPEYEWCRKLVETGIRATQLHIRWGEKHRGSGTISAKLWAVTHKHIRRIAGSVIYIFLIVMFSLAIADEDGERFCTLPYGVAEEWVIRNYDYLLAQEHSLFRKKKGLDRPVPIQGKDYEEFKFGAKRDFRDGLRTLGLQIYSEIQWVPRLG